MNSACTVHAFKNIKNGSHGIIYTFKNYFAIVFLVFSFNNNKFNLNESYIFKIHLCTYPHNIYSNRTYIKTIQSNHLEYQNLTVILLIEMNMVNIKMKQNLKNRKWKFWNVKSQNENNSKIKGAKVHRSLKILVSNKYPIYEIKIFLNYLRTPYIHVV